MLALVAAFAQPAMSQQWSEPQTVGARSTGIVGTGDFNGDGWADVAYARNGAFQWYPGPQLDADGPEYDIGSGSGTSYGGVVADVSGDGWPDLVASDGARSSGPGSLWVFVHPGNAQAAVQPWQRIEIYSLDVWHQNDIAVADMDGDNRLDVVVRTRSDDIRLLVALQNSDLTSWTTRFWPTGETSNTPEGLAVGDVDNDGEQEIVLSGVYWNNPGGWRSGEPEEFMIDSAFVNRAVKSVVADFDSDGQADDIAMVTAEGSTEVYLALYSHNGSPQQGETAWTRSILLDQVTNYHTLAAGDFDADGQIDLLAGASFGDTGIRIFENRSQSWREQVVDADGQMYVTSLADLDNDGNLDFVGPTRWQRRVVAYYSLAPSGVVFRNGFE